MNESGLEYNTLSGNEALVTFTLLSNAEQIIQRRELSIQCLFDLSALADAIILHPRVFVIQGSIPEERKPQYTINFLTSNNLLNFYSPSYSTRELITMMNQYSLFRDLSWFGFSWKHPAFEQQKQKVFESRALLDYFYSDDPWPLEANHILEASTKTLVDESEIGTLIERLRIKNTNVPEYPNLFDIIHIMGTGHSLALRQYLFRTIVYLCSADYDKLTFYPDYVRIPYVSSCVQRLYSNLSREVYERIAEIFGAKIEEIFDEIPGTNLSIPPFLYMVLERVVKGAKFFEAMLEVRSQFESTRNHLNEIDSRIRTARTLIEKRKALKQKKELLIAIAKKYGSEEHLQLKEFISLAQDMAKVSVKPLDPGAYNTSLLVKPYEWIREWWLTRPMAHVLDAVQRLERLPELFDLIHKGLGYSISSEDIKAYKNTRNSVAALVRRYEESGTRFC